MKKIIFVLLVAIVSVTANAQEKKNKNAKYDIEVNGNCEQCKKRIEKAAFSVAGVKSAVWDVDTKILHVIVNEEKATLPVLKQALANVGHDSEGTKAEDETYESLHHCCKYERKP